MNSANFTMPNTESGLAALGAHFGRASLIVLLGVLATWVLIKRDGGASLTELPDLGMPVSEMNAIHSGDQTESLLDRADIAFAAGRIIEPEYDNALAYYAALEKQDPGNADAAAGIDRVVGYLLSQGEGAIYRSDWDAARAYARVIEGIRPAHTGAQSIAARSDRLERIDVLQARALAQFSAGRLISPTGDNASESYKEILSLDPENTGASEGLASVAQRLVANAQSAVFAGNTKQADTLIAQAKSLDPGAAEIKEVERSARQWQRIAEDSSVQNDLVAAAEALQEDRLTGPDEPNAYSLFQRVLERQPKSEAALRGLELVLQGLVDRAWREMRAGRLADAGTALARALDAGATEEQLFDARGELGYLQRLEDARAGKFDRVYGINELTARERDVPEFPRSAEKRELAGSVTVEFTVDERGEVRDSRVAESNNSIFDRSALTAIGRWSFEPVLENGRPVPVRASVKFTFQL